MENKVLYRPILKQAWSITKKFKSLWFFGLFAAIIGFNGEYEILSRAVARPLNEPGIIQSAFIGFQNGLNESLVGAENIWSNLWQVSTINPETTITVIFIALMTILIVVFFFWLSLISQIGLIKNSALAIRGKKTSINEAIDTAVHKFWPVLFVNLILKLILFVLFFLLGAQAILLGRASLAMILLYYISFILFILLIFTTSFILRYQIYFIVLKNKSFKSAFINAWQIFKQNWLTSLEMSFILFVIFLVVTFIASIIVTIIAAVPFAAALYFDLSFGIIGLIGIISLASVIIITFLSSAILQTYQWTSWTLLFNRLAGKDGGTSKIIRSAEEISDKIIN